jgi:hypothetical protein
VAPQIVKFQLGLAAVALVLILSRLSELIAAPRLHPENAPGTRGGKHVFPDGHLGGSGTWRTGWLAAAHAAADRDRFVVAC